MSHSKSWKQQGILFESWYVHMNKGAGGSSTMYQTMPVTTKTASAARQNQRR